MVFGAPAMPPRHWERPRSSPSFLTTAVLGTLAYIGYKASDTIPSAFSLLAGSSSPQTTRYGLSRRPLSLRHATDVAEDTSTEAWARAAIPRRFAALAPTLGAIVGQSPAFAEESSPEVVPRPSGAPSKAVRDRRNIVEILTPADWGTERSTDPNAPLISASTACYGNLYDIAYVTVQVQTLSSLLQDCGFGQSPSDRNASSWADVLKPPVNVETIALELVENKRRFRSLFEPTGRADRRWKAPFLEDNATLQIPLRKMLTTLAGKVKLVNDGKPGPTGFSELVFEGLQYNTLFRSETEIVPERIIDDLPPAGVQFGSGARPRTLEARVLLGNGVVFTVIANALSGHWKDNYLGEVNRPFLESILNSFRILPKEARKLDD